MNQIFIGLFLLSILNLVFIEAGKCGCQKSKLKRAISLKIDDMLLDHVDLMKIEGFRGYDKNARRWTDNTLKYTFHPQFPADKKQIVRESMNELTNDLKGCVKYVESTSGYHIKVQSHQPGCWSFVGMLNKQGGSQELNLENPGCLYSKGTIKHEFIHATGFMHTQMRADRDKFVNIFWERIDSDFCHAFVTCKNCEETVTYKTNSVMHYPSESFPCPGQRITMVDKQNKEIPYNHGTIEEDHQMIKHLYQCK
uniref:Metalloendopeptidase n=1 Tax=Schmidtea mediterranea TaxID=79327 RepID=A0A060Q750_SCHMD|nr:Ast5 protein [Schmidtea mediterranea]